MTKRILVLGATGMLGQPAVRSLVKSRHQVRILVRNIEKAKNLFGDTVEMVPGNAANGDDFASAIRGCDAVHINLTQEVELKAIQHVLDLAAESLERISFVSATTVCEENRWFPMVDTKMRCEELLQQSGIPFMVFCPTWVMETLHNFIHGDRAVMIIGKNPPPLHFIAAVDFGRIVAASYADERALGKRLFVHGPEAIPLPVAIERFVKACHPDLNLLRLQLWQAKVIAKLTRRQAMAGAVELISYFDKEGEIGEPEETNALFGAPSITLDEWLAMPQQQEREMPH